MAEEVPSTDRSIVLAEWRPYVAPSHARFLAVQPFLQSSPILSHWLVIISAIVYFTHYK